MWSDYLTPRRKGKKTSVNLMKCFSLLIKLYVVYLQELEVVPWNNEMMVLFLCTYATARKTVHSSIFNMI